MKHAPVASLVSAVWMIVACGDALLPSVVRAQTPVRSFKLAFFNIQSGKGKLPLAGNPSPFADTGNCTDPAKPMNAWGQGIVQAELIARVANDPGVVALGLAEAWLCANPEAVRAVLQWPAVSGERNGVALLARFGFAGSEEWVQLDTSLNQNPADTMWVLRRSVCLDAACSASIPVFTAHWFPFTTVMADSYTEAA